MELWYLISAHHLMMLYICTKVQENISKGYRVAVCILKYSKGHNSVGSVGGNMELVLSHCLMVFYVCTKFCPCIS